MRAPRLILDYLPCFCRKIIRVCGDFTKLWQKQFCLFFETRCSSLHSWNSNSKSFYQTPSVGYIPSLPLAVSSND